MPSKSLLILSLVSALALGAVSSVRAELTEEMAAKLFATNTSLEEFEKVAAEALKKGAPAQVVAEAKLVWGLSNKDTEYLAKIVPELEEAAKNFKNEVSVAMRSVDEFQAFIHYIKALEAARNGDASGVKLHITEAFWLSPEQANLYAQTITFFRRQAKMASVRVDMKLTLTNSKGEETTLGDVLGKNKAVLLDFWATWCAPCMMLMPQVKAKSEYLAKHGVVVAGMNIESSLALAERTREEQDMKKVVWLVEPKDRPFSAGLEVDSYPRMVLITGEGKVLFNGHSEDPALWAALKNVDPTIEPLPMATLGAPGSNPGPETVTKPEPKVETAPAPQPEPKSK